MSELESLADDEVFDRHLDRHRLDRLLMLCDGVFAIAITLAALEIHVPHGLGDLGQALAEMTPELITYGISFIVIAMFWISNRELFARVHRVDGVLTALVLALLCVAALIPASSHMVEGNSTGSIDGSLRFYALNMVVAGAINCATWIYAAASRGVMRSDVPRGYRWQRAVMAATMPVLFCLVLTVPTRQMLSWLVPAALAAIALRRILLPRLFTAK